MNIQNYTYPILITIFYFFIYYGFYLNQVLVKLSLFKEYKSRGEKFDRYFGQDPKMLAADRPQLNTLEQMPIFLWSFWLNAIFVDTKTTSILGAIYCFSRILYPILMGRVLKRTFSKKIFLSTFTGYFVILTFIFRLIINLL